MTLSSHGKKYKAAITSVIATLILTLGLLIQPNLESLVQRKDNEPLQLVPASETALVTTAVTAPSGKPSPNSSLQGDSDRVIAASAWSAQTAIDALKITQSSELNESRLNILLHIIRSSCKVANFRASKIKIPRGQLEINQKQAVEAFLKSYCGDVAKLDLLITQRLGPNETAFKSRSHDEETMLLLAAKPSNELASALINDVLTSPDVDLARLTAPLISRMTKTSGPLEDWQKFLPENPSFADLNAVYTIVGEIISCQQHRGCGSNEILSMHECLMGRGCQPGEDLLAYRRRTTSPMLYQAAEQIAAAMQARRYR